MNDVRCLTAVGLLAIGTLGLGMPTAFAAGLPHYCDVNQECSSMTPDNSSGQTTYYPSKGSYLIHNQSAPHSRVAVRFFHPGGMKFIPPKFDFCDETNCSGQLTEELTSSFCMSMAVVPMGKKGDYQKGDLYEKSDQVCYDSRK